MLLVEMWNSKKAHSRVAGQPAGEIRVLPARVPPQEGGLTNSIRVEPWVPTWGKGRKWQVLEDGLVHAGLEEKAKNDNYLKMALFTLDLRKRPKTTSTWRWNCSRWTWGKGQKRQLFGNGLVHAGLEEKAENEKYLKMALLMLDLRKRPKMKSTWRWPCSFWTWGKGQKLQVIEDGLVHAGLEEKAENDKYLKMALFVLDLRERPKMKSAWRWPCTCWTRGKGRK